MTIYQFPFFRITHLYIQHTGFYNCLGFFTIYSPVNMYAECDPAIFRELCKRHFIGNSRCFIFGSDRLHDLRFLSAGITTIRFISKPFTVRICFYIKISSGKSKSKWRVTTLFYQPTIGLTCFIDNVTIFILFRITLFVKYRHLIMCCIFLKDHPVIQFQKLLCSELLHFSVRSRNQSTIRHSVPLGKDSRYIPIQCGRNINRELIIT